MLGDVCKEKCVNAATAVHERSSNSSSDSFRYKEAFVCQCVLKIADAKIKDLRYAPKKNFKAGGIRRSLFLMSFSIIISCFLRFMQSLTVCNGRSQHTRTSWGGGRGGLQPSPPPPPPQLAKLCDFSNKTLIIRATTLEKKHSKIMLLV